MSKYSDSQKSQAVGIAKLHGVTKAAAQTNIPAGTIWGWVHGKKVFAMKGAEKLTDIDPNSVNNFIEASSEHPEGFEGEGKVTSFAPEDDPFFPTDGESLKDHVAKITGNKSAKDLKDDAQEAIDKPTTVQSSERPTRNKSDWVTASEARRKEEEQKSKELDKAIAKSFREQDVSVINNYHTFTPDFTEEDTKFNLDDHPEVKLFTDLAEELEPGVIEASKKQSSLNEFRGILQGLRNDTLRGKVKQRTNQLVANRILDDDSGRYMTPELADWMVENARSEYLDDQGYPLVPDSTLKQRANISQEELGLRNKISSVIDAWKDSSTSSKSIALHIAVADLFGIDDSLETLRSYADEYGDQYVEGVNEYETNAAFYETMARAVYDGTQELFKQNGITSIRVMRGMTPHRSQASWMQEPSWDMVLKEGKPFLTVNPELGPLSSFSADPSTADSFGESGATIAGEIPVSKVFCTAITGPGCLNETEFLVVGGKLGPMNISWESTKELSGFFKENEDNLQELGKAIVNGELNPKAKSICADLLQNGTLGKVPVAQIQQWAEEYGVPGDSDVWKDAWGQSASEAADWLSSMAVKPELKPIEPNVAAEWQYPKNPYYIDTIQTLELNNSGIQPDKFKQYMGLFTTPISEGMSQASVIKCLLKGITTDQIYAFKDTGLIAGYGEAVVAFNGDIDEYNKWRESPVFQPRMQNGEAVNYLMSDWKEAGYSLPEVEMWKKILGDKASTYEADLWKDSIFTPEEIMNWHSVADGELSPDECKQFRDEGVTPDQIDPWWGMLNSFRLNSSFKAKVLAPLINAGIHVKDWRRVIDATGKGDPKARRWITINPPAAAEFIKGGGSIDDLVKVAGEAESLVTSKHQIEEILAGNYYIKSSEITTPETQNKLLQQFEHIADEWDELTNSQTAPDSNLDLNDNHVAIIDAHLDDLYQSLIHSKKDWPGIVNDIKDRLKISGLEDEPMMKRFIEQLSHLKPNVDVGEFLAGKPKKKISKKSVAKSKGY